MPSEVLLCSLSTKNVAEYVPIILSLPEPTLRNHIVQGWRQFNSELHSWFQAKFYGKLSMHHNLSPEHLFPFQSFQILIFFFRFRYSTGAKINQNATHTVFTRPEPNFMVNKVVMRVI